MDDIVAYSRDRIERGSKSFAGAARLFDADTRASAYMLYAWCRHCDDVIDGQELGRDIGAGTGEAQRAVLVELTAQTRAALQGRTDAPVFEALRLVTQKHDIPDTHPMELLEGFRMDVDCVPFHTIDDTLAYSYHVAGVVGVMMAMIMGVRDRATLNRASDLGIAFQLTNIARDVVADANGGRCYLPDAWLIAEGIAATPDAVADPANRTAVHRATVRLLDTADQYYASAAIGVRALPPRAAWAIAAARNVYSEIGDVVRARGTAAWDQRAYVPKSRKAVGVARGGLQVIAAKSAKALGFGGAARAHDRSGLWTHQGLGEAAQRTADADHASASASAI